MRQLTFDDAKTRRAEAIDRVDRNADPTWRENAIAFVRRYAETHETVFCDELWKAGLEPPREGRALGPVMLHAARAKWIEASGQFRPSAQSSMAPKPVWRSLIYKGAAA